MSGSTRGAWRGAAATLAPLSLVALAVAQLWPGLSAGLSPPIGWDHGAHLGKAILTWNAFWPGLRGWTDLMEAGVPLQTLYSPTGTLWILLFRTATPWLAWHQTYALAFAGFRALVGLASYRLARVAGAGIPGALVAGALALADEGDHSEGGWFYDVQFGVWPMSFAMCVFFLGLADLLRFLDGGARRHGARAMLLLGVALFSHQASLLALGALVPSLALCRATERPALGRDVARVSGVLVVAGLVSAWWMLPMFAHTAWLDDHGQLYRSGPEIGASIAEGRGILRGGPWVGPLVGLGLVAGLVARGHRRTLALAAVVAMVVSTPGWLLATDATRWVPSLGRIMFPRFMMVAKPMLFALGGAVVGDVVARVGPALRATLGSTRGRASLALTAALAAPLLAGAPDAIANALVRRDTVTTATLGDWEDRQRAWAWLRDQPARPFFRVLSFDQGTHLPQAAPAYMGHPGLIHGVLVAEAFRNTLDSLDPAALRAVNVRYVLSTGATPGALRPVCHEVARFGSQGICELEGWHGDVASDPSGAARPRVERLEGERVEIVPSGATRVLVRRAFSPGWEATIDGVVVPIEPVPVEGSARMRLMGIDVPVGATRLVLRHVGVRGPTWLGLVLTSLGLGLIALFVSAARLPASLRARAEAARATALARVPGPIARRPGRAALAVALVGVGVFALRATRGHHFAYDLARASVSIRDDAGRETPCRASDEGGATWSCPGVPGATIGRVTQIVDGRFHGCIATPPPIGRGTLVLAWPDAPLRGSLALATGVSDEVHDDGLGAPLDVAVVIDGREATRLSVPSGRAWVEEALDTTPGPHALRVEVRSSGPARRPLCVDLVAR